MSFILSWGRFDSDTFFPGASVTRERVVYQFELEFYVEDAGVSIFPGEEVPLRSGLILVAKPGDRRHSILPVKCYFLKLEDGEGPIGEFLSRLPRTIYTEDISSAIALVNEIAFAEETGDESRRWKAVFALLAFIEGEREASVARSLLPTRRQSAVRAAIAYMNKNFKEEKCTLERIAMAAHFSPVYFHGIFTEEVGKTPLAYLNEVRLAEAKRQLALSDSSIGEIATSCGYSTQAYFNYIFKKALGESPRSYRNRMQLKYLDNKRKI